MAAPTVVFGFDVSAFSPFRLLRNHLPLTGEFPFRGDKSDASVILHFALPSLLREGGTRSVTEGSCILHS